eukprot:2614677-Amphidinium_carterae.2
MSDLYVTKLAVTNVFGCHTNLIKGRGDAAKSMFAHRSIPPERRALGTLSFKRHVVVGPNLIKYNLGEDGPWGDIQNTSVGYRWCS